MSFSFSTACIRCF